MSGISAPATIFSGTDGFALTHDATPNGTVTAEHFEDHISDPDLAKLRENIHLTFDREVGETASFVRVALKDGASKEFYRDSNRPETNLARQEGRLVSKFMMLATPVLGEDRTADLCETVLQRDRSAGLDKLFNLLRPASERVPTR